MIWLMTASKFIKDLTLLKAKYPSDNSRHLHEPGPHNKTLGIRMGSIFALAKKYTQMPPGEITKLFASDYYEVRVGAVSIMDFRARDKKTSPEIKKELYTIYIKNHSRINNWDLVDRSAPHVVGGYLFDKDRKPLYKLAKSKNVWERRTAITATWFFIRQNDIDDTFALAEILVHDKAETVNKAVGSWLREAGKRDKERLLAFLDQYAPTMPRITLRYATEKLTPKEKKKYFG